MKREHKAGLAVSVAFLALLAVVVVVKLREPAASPSAPPSPTLAMRGEVKEDTVGSDPAPGDDADKSGGKPHSTGTPPPSDPPPPQASPGPGLGEPGAFSNPGPVVQVKAADPKPLSIDPPPPPMNDDPPPPPPPPMNDDPPAAHKAKPVDGGFTPIPPPLAPGGGDPGDPPPPADDRGGKLPPIGQPDPVDDPNGDGKAKPDHGKPAPVNSKHDGDPPPVKTGAIDPPPPANDPPPPPVKQGVVTIPPDAVPGAPKNDGELHPIKIDPPPPADKVDPPAPAKIDPPPPAVVPAPDSQGRPVIVIPPTGAPSNPPASVGIGAPVIAATAGSLGATVDSWDEETYVCQSGDSFPAVARRFYKADEYADALQLYNRNHPRATDAMRRDGALQPGDRLYVPPPTVLEKRHGSAITKPKAPGAAVAPAPGGEVQTAGFTGAPQPLKMQPSAPAPAPTYTVPPPGEPLASIARRTLQNSSRWQEIAQLNPTLRPEAPVPAGTVVRLPADALVPAPGNP